MLESGQIIEGKYRIARLVGEGGMGSVYEGENTLIRRRVAIKVLHASSVSTETVLRFEREAQAAGCIGSDHILEVLDLGSLPNGDRFMVMEFLDGETLGARMSRGRMNAADVVAIARQVLVGLRAAHLANIVHRDLKPDNIFILREKAGRPDFAKIIDFGISKFNALGGDMSMTRTGAVMGTPYYMSPEQAQGTQNIDGRSDVYSLGVIMYEALSGAVPFDGGTFNELMFKIVLSSPRSLAQVAPGLDPKVVWLVERAMARSLEERFASADDMLHAIDEGFVGAGGDLRRTGVNAVVDGPSPAVARPPTLGGVPTGNTWAASHADIPKHSNTPLFMVAGVLFLLGAGAAFAAYQRFGSKSSAKVEDGAPSAIAAEKKLAKSAAPGVALPAAPVVSPEATPAGASTSAKPANDAPAVANAAPDKPDGKALRAPAKVAPAQAPSRAIKSRAPAKAASRDFGY